MGYRQTGGLLALCSPCTWWPSTLSECHLYGESVKDRSTPTNGASLPAGAPEPQTRRSAPEAYAVGRTSIPRVSTSAMIFDFNHWLRMRLTYPEVRMPTVAAASTAMMPSGISMNVPMVTVRSVATGKVRASHRTVAERCISTQKAKKTTAPVTKHVVMKAHPKRTSTTSTATQAL